MRTKGGGGGQKGGEQRGQIHSCGVNKGKAARLPPRRAQLVWPCPACLALLSSSCPTALLHSSASSHLLLLPLLLSSSTRNAGTVSVCLELRVDGKPRGGEGGGENDGSVGAPGGVCEREKRLS